jgi:hypothetical protein
MVKFRLLLLDKMGVVQRLHRDLIYILLFSQLILEYIPGLIVGLSQLFLFLISEALLLVPQFLFGVLIVE